MCHAVLCHAESNLAHGLVQRQYGRDLACRRILEVCSRIQRVVGPPGGSGSLKPCCTVASCCSPELQHLTATSGPLSHVRAPAFHFHSAETPCRLRSRSSAGYRRQNLPTKPESAAKLSCFNAPTCCRGCYMPRHGSFQRPLCLRTKPRMMRAPWPVSQDLQTDIMLSAQLGGILAFLAHCVTGM